MASGNIFPLDETSQWHNGTIIFLPRSDILDSEGNVRIDVLPTSVIGSKITFSPTPPENPQIGDTWVIIE